MLEAYTLHPQAFTSSSGERADLPLIWWKKRLAQEDNASEVVFAAIDQDKILGVVGLTFNTRDKARHKVALFGMYVSSTDRGRGLGRALVEAALVYAADRSHARLVQLTVSEHNAAALRLYTQCGFERFGLEPCATLVDGQFVAKIHMWRMLPERAQADQAIQSARD
jgi:ribosomal protein S18 acetylase RimI-like enzyme